MPNSYLLSFITSLKPKLFTTAQVSKTSYKKAFTIIELMVVIVIIGILATIALMSYAGMTKKATEATLVSDLGSASEILKLSRIENNSYPVASNTSDYSKITDCPSPAPGNACIKLSPGNSFGVFWVDNTVIPRTFCLTIKSANNIKYHVTNNSVPESGGCTFPIGSILTATTFSRSKIDLSWDAVTDATKYTLQRSANLSFTNPITIATQSTNATFRDTGLSQATTYYYRINATVDGDDSFWSTTVNATTSTFYAPTGFDATLATNSSVNLTWNTVSGAESYTVQRATNSSFTAGLVTVPTTLALSAVSSGLSTGINYYYRINVTDAEGPSAWSGTLTLNLASYTQTYATPGNYAYTIPAGAVSVTLEAWGAQGGYTNIGDCNGVTPGGYAKGNLSVLADYKLNIYVGGRGGNGTAAVGGGTGVGGYNGGGNGGNGYGAGGGGASDIRYSAASPTILQTSSVYRIIVAGGAGGDGYKQGGVGGGASGGNGVAYGTPGGYGGSNGVGGAGGDVGTPGTSTTGGNGSGGFAPAGGGGGYGGGGGSQAGGGGGGGGYTGGVTSGTMSSGVQYGDGKVIITYVLLTKS